MAFQPRYDFVFSLFLNKILDETPTGSLYNCRKVNSFWKCCTDPILLQRSNNVISFAYSPIKNAFVCYSKSPSLQPGKNEYSDEGKDLNYFLYNFNSTEFSSLPPTQNFHFTGPNFRPAETLFGQFMSMYSSSIKELSLNWDGRKSLNFENVHSLDLNIHPPNVLLWLTIIANGNLHQLEKLKITNFWSYQPHVDMVDELRQYYPAQPLPSLKFVEIEMSNRYVWAYDGLDEILPDLIQMAPNLQQVYYSKYFFGENMQQVLLERPNIFRVECLNFRLFCERQSIFPRCYPLKVLEYTEKYCSENKGLLYLNLESCDPPNSPAMFLSTIIPLLKLLKRSQHSLEHLQLENGTLILLIKMAKAVRIDQFPRVKSLRFASDSQDVPRLIFNKYPVLFEELLGESWDSSPLPSFPTLFPQLEDLDIMLAECFETFFPLSNEILPKVSSLCIHPVTGCEQTLCKLLELVPIVRKVKLFTVTNFPCISQQLWQLENLETLILIIEIIDELETPAHVFPFIDCAFTGLPEEILLLNKCIGTNNEILDGPAMYHTLRKNPSILNLRKFTKLELVFQYIGTKENYEKHFRGFLTDASFKFGFCMMDNLSVTIKTCSEILSESLRPFSSYQNVSVRLNGG